MNLSKGQGDLFTENYYSKQAVFLEDEVFFSKKVIEDWQQMIHSYQKPLHQQNVANVLQKTIPKLKEPIIVQSIAILNLLVDLYRIS